MKRTGMRAVAAALILLCGCGYRFSPGGEHINKEVRTVYIAPLANKTNEANIENRFRSAFVDWFIKTSRFQVVDQESRADAIWQGSVNSLTTSALSYQTSNLAAEERMTVVLELKFVERESGKVIWADRAFSSYQDYKITDVMNTDSARKNAESKLSVDTAERAYRAMMSGF
jgi:hypothetical protein